MLISTRGVVGEKRRLCLLVRVDSKKLNGKIRIFLNVRNETAKPSGIHPEFDQR